jgi:hypothetical protein
MCWLLVMLTYKHQYQRARKYIYLDRPLNSISFYKQFHILFTAFFHDAAFNRNEKVFPPYFIKYLWWWRCYWAHNNTTFKKFPTFFVYEFRYMLVSWIEMKSYGDNNHEWKSCQLLFRLLLMFHVFKCLFSLSWHLFFFSLKMRKKNFRSSLLFVSVAHFVPSNLTQIDFFRSIRKVNECPLKQSIFLDLKCMWDCVRV